MRRPYIDRFNYFLLSDEQWLESMVEIVANVEKENAARGKVISSVKEEMTREIFSNRGWSIIVGKQLQPGRGTAA